jgi:hypothetical protein
LHCFRETKKHPTLANRVLAVDAPGTDKPQGLPVLAAAGKQAKAGQTLSQSIHWSIDQSINQSINRSIDRSINQSINQSINRSIDQPSVSR